MEEFKEKKKFIDKMYNGEYGAFKTFWLIFMPTALLATVINSLISMIGIGILTTFTVIISIAPVIVTFIGFKRAIDSHKKPFKAIFLTSLPLLIFLVIAVIALFI